MECPAGVDIPKLMIEGKAKYVTNNGLRLDDWVMSRLDIVGAIGGLLSPFTNWMIRNRQARWIVEKVLGVAQRRKLPRFASRSFLRRAARRRLTNPTRRTGRKVLYFVDVYANYHDPQLAEALVGVLEHNGVPVYVHPDQAASGMSMMSRGAIDAARKVATANVRILAEAIRQGYAIVATEPSAVLCLTREYPLLLDDDDTRLVAANTFEACHYLWQMHRHGKAATRFQASQRHAWLSSALPFEGPGRRFAWREPAAIDSRAVGAEDRTRMFWHGRHLRTSAKELPQ